MALAQQIGGARQGVARFAQLTVAYNVAVILWGAYVRATGSGAGCGGHWPLCNGQVIPATTQAETMIEFTHRVTSGAALVLTCVLVIWCWRKTTKGEWARYSAVLAILLMFNEALLGALLVIFDHVGMDRSSGRVLFQCLHFGNTLLLVGALSLTANWLADADSHFALRARLREAIAVVFGLASVITIGVTGSLAALGDTLFPIISLRHSLAQDFSAESDVLLRLRLLHPVAAVLGSAYVLWIMRRLYRKQERPTGLLTLIGGTLAVQVALGLLNVVMLAPLPLQIAHLLVADVFWILLVVASADLLLVPAPASSTNPAQQGIGSLTPLLDA